MKHLSRRNFLKRGALLGATASLAPQILSADTLGLNGRVGPNSRINVGFIGMGGMMAPHLRLSQMPGVHPLYICDVRQNRLDWGTQQMANRNYNEVTATQDFEDIIEVLRDFQWVACLFFKISIFPATKYSIVIKLSGFLNPLAFRLTAEKTELSPSRYAVVILPEPQKASMPS